MDRNIVVRALLMGAVLLWAAGAGYAQAGATTLYVATNGNDAWTGLAAAPNADGTDGPLATLAGARDVIRKLKAEGKASGPVRVTVRGGAYRVTEPLVFGPEDSGTADAPISYEAYEGEQPVVHGGRAITGWTQEGALWVVDLPEVREGTWDFGALWVNGERRVPARTPNAHSPAGDEPQDNELFFMAGPVMEKDAEGKEQRSATRFYYRPGDLQAWPSLKDSVFVVYHSWETALMRPKSIDEANRIIEFTGPTNWGFGYWRNDQWYFIEHLFEALDQPGEWFLNRAEGKLYYMPMPGEQMTTVDAVAPVAKQLVLLDGKPAEGKFVEYLTFRGLRFYYSNYAIEPQGHSDGQAASTVPAAFQAVGARHCTLEGCEIGHVGTYGVWFRAGCQDNLMRHCEAFDLGAGGVRVGECGDAPSENEAALRNVVDNCFLHDGGRIFRGAIGYWVGRSSYNELTHCEVCDFRYSGLSIGWSWGYAPSSANHNLIAYNNVHHVGHGQLSDMGAIYTLGVSPGTVIRNNAFHDVLSNGKVSGGWGIYFDEGSSEILAENNVVYNTLTGTLHQHYGKENRVQNNVFAFSHRGQLIRSREEEHISFFFDRNIVCFNNGQLLGSAWGNGHWEADNNCYWDTSGDELDFAGRTFAEWQAEGFDQHSIIADPLFENPEAGDFRLKPDSPALALGFQPIDVSTVGLYGEAEWVNKPKLIVREAFPLPETPKPYTFSDGFEDTPAGEQAAGASTQGEEGDAKIRVTEETAASGKHSLKFIDAPGLKHAFNPHLVYTPAIRKGIVVGSFAARVEPGAVLFHEWRDKKSPYTIGPSLWLNGASELTVQGKTLLQVPPSAWVRFEVTCALGQAADGTFDLVVTLPDQAPQRFEKLPCGNPAFRRLDWLGFVSNADAATVMYLDDVSLNIKQ